MWSSEANGKREEKRFTFVKIKKRESINLESNDEQLPHRYFFNIQPLFIIILYLSKVNRFNLTIYYINFIMASLSQLLKKKQSDGSIWCKLYTLGAVFELPFVQFKNLLIKYFKASSLINTKLSFAVLTH